MTWNDTHSCPAWLGGVPKRAALDLCFDASGYLLDRWGVCGVPGGGYGDGRNGVEGEKTRPIGTGAMFAASCRLGSSGRYGGPCARYASVWRVWGLRSGEVTLPSLGTADLHTTHSACGDLLCGKQKGQQRCCFCLRAHSREEGAQIPTVLELCVHMAWHVGTPSL